MGGLPLAGEHKDRPLELWKKWLITDVSCSRVMAYQGKKRDG